MRRECYWMISKYVKEQKRYTQDELRKIFECTADETVQIIRKLKEYGIVKNVKKSDRQSMLSDLVEEDIRVTDIESGERELYYVFSFVGVIVVYGRVLKCYPKYINSCGSPIAQMKQIMRVLEKYNSKEQVIKLYNESDDGGSFNLLAVMEYMLMTLRLLRLMAQEKYCGTEQSMKHFHIYQIIGHIILNYRQKSELLMNMILSDAYMHVY